MGLALQAPGLLGHNKTRSTGRYVLCGPIFFRVGPPGKLQATSPQALKLDSFRVLGYYKILKTKGKNANS